MRTLDKDILSILLASNNFVDDKSIQVDGKQRIITIDGYIRQLVSKGGLMYLEFIGKPPNEDIASYP